MRPLGTLQNSNLVTSPYAVVVVFDTATHTPQYALAQEGVTPDYVGMVWFQGTPLMVYSELDVLEITDQRPQSGAGVCRRAGTMTLMPTDSYGKPYARSPFTEAFYSGGLNPKDFYFGVYVIDRARIQEDLTLGLFHGMFNIDVDMTWSESSPPQRVNLIDMIVNDEYIAGTPATEVPNVLEMYNPWLPGKIIPKVYGEVQRIKLVNAFGTEQQGAVVRKLQGMVGADYTDISTEIILETNVTSISLLLPMTIVSPLVKIQISDTEIISGTLVYDVVDNIIKLTALTRNLPLAELDMRTFTAPLRSEGFGPLVTDDFPTFWDYGSVTIPAGSLEASITDVRQTFQGYEDPTNRTGHGYRLYSRPLFMTADVHFYDVGSPDNERLITKTVPVLGYSTFGDYGYLVQLFIDRFHDATYGDTTITTRFSSTTYDRSAYGSHTEPGLDHMYFDPQTNSGKLYLSDPALGPSSGTKGTNWSIVGFGQTVLEETAAYIQTDGGVLSASGIYFQGRDGLILADPIDIVSITTGVSAFGYDNLTKVLLSHRPATLFATITSNIVFADVKYPSGPETNTRTERVIANILNDSPILSKYIGATLTPAGFPGANILPFTGVVARGESVSALLDKICYQCGVSLVWRDDGVNIVYCAIPGNLRTKIVNISGQDYVKPLAPVLDANNALMQSCSIRTGKLLGKVDEYGYESGSIIIHGKYGGWEDPKFQNSVVDGIPYSTKTVDRELSINLDLVQDRISFYYAIGSMLSAGHQSGLATTERNLTMQMLLQECRLEALDVVVVKNFPGVTDSASNNPALYLDSDGYPYYKVHPLNKWFYMGGLCVIESVKYSYVIDAPVVEVNMKQCSPYLPALTYNIPGAPWPPVNPVTFGDVTRAPDFNSYSSLGPGGPDTFGPPPPGNPGGPPNPGGPGAPPGDGPPGSTSYFYGSPQTVDVTGSASLLCDSTAIISAAIVLTLNVFYGNLGITWAASIAASDLTGISISGTTEAASSDKTSDAWVPEGPWTLYANVLHTAFKSRDTISFTYEVVVMRTAPRNYRRLVFDTDEVGRIEVDCTLKELTNFTIA